MACRSVLWRRVCPDELERCFEEVMRVTLYIVHQTGPTGFILKEDGSRKKVKVYLGDPHMCSCSAFKRTRELCFHILWVMLKKFRIPRSNPVIWQLGLIEREINEILRGYLIRQSPTPSKDHTPSSQQAQIPQKEIGPDDVCPICQDDLLGSARRVTYCRFGCGKSVHVKCMKIWAEHQKSTGDSTLRCPLCREDFGSIVVETRVSRLTGSEQDHRHLGVACSECHVCPVVGKCYKCCVCESYYLCHKCFASNQVHLNHSFQFRQHCDQPWRAVPHPSAPPPMSPRAHALSPMLVSSLQSRSLTESDYEILLNLDNHRPNQSTSYTQGSNQRSRPLREGVAERLVASLHVEPLDRHHPLVVGGACCHICQERYVLGDWIKKLPCKHKFHRGCVDSWLQSHTTCPVDNRPLCDPSHNRLVRPAPNPSEDTPTLLAPRQQLASLGRGRLVPGGTMLGVAIGSHGNNPGGDNEFSIWGRGLQNEGERRKKPSKKAFSTSSLPTLKKATPNATPIGNPLSDAGIVASALQLKHLPTYHRPHLKLTHLGGERSSDLACGVGMANRRGCSLGGRVRKGLMVSGGRSRPQVQNSSVLLGPDSGLLVSHLKTRNVIPPPTNHTLPLRLL